MPLNFQLLSLLTLFKELSKELLLKLSLLAMLKSQPTQCPSISIRFNMQVLPSTLNFLFYLKKQREKEKTFKLSITLTLLTSHSQLLILVYHLTLLKDMLARSRQSLMRPSQAPSSNLLFLTLRTSKFSKTVTKFILDMPCHLRLFLSLIPL